MPDHNGSDRGERASDGQSSADGREGEHGDERSGGPSVNSAVLDLDNVFDVLDHPRRRYLLYTLASNDRWTLTELATKVAAWETSAEQARVDEATRDRIYVSLYHAHVPKLVDEGVVQFDEERGTVTPGPHADQVLTVLESVGASLDSRQESHAERGYEENG